MIHPSNVRDIRCVDMFACVHYTSTCVYTNLGRVCLESTCEMQINQGRAPTANETLRLAGHCSHKANRVLIRVGIWLVELIARPAYMRDSIANQLTGN